jgi:DNA-directed RNA polymerase subunit alpha
MAQFQMECLESKTKSVRNLYGRYKLEPLLPGQGYTLGNALRRTLLSNIECVAISGVRIAGIQHEYSTIPGIREDVLEILLNLKDIVLVSTTKSTQIGRLKIQGPVVVTSSHFDLSPEVKIVDPRQYIATITTNTVLEIEFRVEHGQGYNLVEQSASTDFFNIDAVFMPIQKLGFNIEEIIASNSEKHERLIIEVTTNGSIDPKEAIIQGAKILVALLEPLQTFATSTTEHKELKQELKYNRIMIEELQLSVRAYNCLKRAQIHTVADLMEYSQTELLEIKNFGSKSANEVIEAVEKRLGFALFEEQPSIKD